MTNSYRILLAAGLAATTALAGCQMGGGERMARLPSMPGAAPMASSIEGDWVSTDGVAISRFTNGQFETLATDTGAKLAEGTYSYVDPSNVSITLTSLIRQTTSQVNCALVTPTQLNCTGSGGQQFSLMRGSAVG